jgi:hypothetical protein
VFGLERLDWLVLLGMGLLLAFALRLLLMGDGA